MIYAIIILSIVVIGLAYLAYYQFINDGKKSEKIIKQETQIDALLLQYNDNKKKIKDIEKARIKLKQTELTSVKSVCNLLDNL